MDFAESTAAPRDNPGSLNFRLLMVSADSCGAVNRNRSIDSILNWKVKTTLEHQNVFKGNALPPARNDGARDRVFVAREAEADEPLFVKQPRRLLQQRHPPAVVFDQVVVGRKCRND